MRLSTVLFITTIGAAIGAAAVLIPLNSRDTSSASAWVAALPISTSDAGSLAIEPGVRQPSGSQPSKISPGASAKAPDFAGFAADPSVKASITPWAAQTRLASEASSVQLASSRGATDEQRVKLASQIQHELIRVGCFDDTADGDWNSASKTAMSAFLAKVNARLPHDNPDDILLTLVKGHVGPACGLACPAGQGANTNGRCAPSTVQAQSAGSKSKATYSAPDSTAAAAAAAVIAGAQLAPSIAVPVPQLVKRWPAKIATEATPPTTATATVTAQATAPMVVAKATPAVRPLPGRMSIGGPVAPPLAVAATDHPAKPIARPDGVRTAKAARTETRDPAATTPDISVVATDKPQLTAETLDAAARGKTTRSDPPAPRRTATTRRGPSAKSDRAQRQASAPRRRPRPSYGFYGLFNNQSFGY